jgi:hypothetical protein
LAYHRGEGLDALEDALDAALAFLAPYSLLPFADLEARLGALREAARAQARWKFGDDIWTLYDLRAAAWAALEPVQRVLIAADAMSRERRAAGDPPAPTPGNVDPKVLARALLLSPERLTIPQIAARVGLSRQALYDDTGFRYAAERAGVLKPRAKRGDRGANVPRGHRAKDGRIEAYDEEDE